MVTGVEERAQTVTEPLPGKASGNLLRRAQTVTWNEEVTATWQDSRPDETLTMRGSRYVSYMCPTDRQLNGLCTRMKSFVEDSIQGSTYRTLSDPKVIPLPEDFNGVRYVVEFSPKDIIAARVEKVKGDCKVDIATTPMKDADISYTKGDTTAYDLFEAIAKTVAKLPHEAEPAHPHKVVFMSGYLCQFRHPNSCILKDWSRGLKTGNLTDDPVVGGDMGAMLSYAFDRMQMPFEVAYSFPNMIGVLEAAHATVDTAETNSEIRFVLDLDVGLTAAGIQSATGMFVDSEIGTMSKDLPHADFDLEVDDADGNFNTCLLEKLCAHRYITEIARRVIIKVLLNDAPENAWTMYSLPMHVISRIVMDKDEELTLTRDLLQLVWDWDCSLPHALEIKRICDGVLSRSAALVAAIIVAQAKAFSALQPALGSSVVAITGRLYNDNEFYRTMVKDYIDTLAGTALSSLLILKGISTPTVVGGALRALRLDANMQNKTLLQSLAINKNQNSSQK